MLYYVRAELMWRAAPERSYHAIPHRTFSLGRSINVRGVSTRQYTEGKRCPQVHPPERFRQQPEDLEYEGRNELTNFYFFEYRPFMVGTRLYREPFTRRAGQLQKVQHGLVT